MRVLGIETSCDETGVALYDTERGLLADALYSQIDIHAEYGGVVPELASRDHVRKTLPLIDQVRENTRLPISVLGGAGSLEDLRGLVDRYGVIGAAAGSLFVFKGKYRAVLIQYPSLVEKETLLSSLI